MTCDFGSDAAVISPMRSMTLVLDTRPDDPRMLRVVILAACAIGVDKEARQYYPRLAQGERGAVASRCRGHGIDLER